MAPDMRSVKVYKMKLLSLELWNIKDIFDNADDNYRSNIIKNS